MRIGELTITERLWFAIAGIAIVFGVYFRLKGLSIWPLATDEYYVGKSIGHIVENGVPAPQCSGWGLYLRGVLYQYFVAPVIVAGVETELALRLISVLSNLLAIPAVFILGNRISGRVAACVAVLFFSLSGWEIEFARFGRMYAMFQALFMWYLVFLYDVTIKQRADRRKWLFVFSILGLLTWEGGIFLAVLNFVPILYSRDKRLSVSDLVVPVLVLVFAVFYLKFDPGMYSLSANLPPGLTLDFYKVSPIGDPPLMWLTFADHIGWIALFTIPLVISFSMGLSVFKTQGLTLIGKTGIACLIVFSLLHLFGLALGLFVLMLLLGWLSGGRQVVTRVAVALVVNAAFWVAFGLMTQTWHGFFQDFQSADLVQKLIAVLLKYPNIFDAILFQWLAEMPIMTIMMVVLVMMAGIWCVLRPADDSLDELRLLMIVGVSLALIIGVMNTRYVSTRYTFFLYPLILIISATVVWKGSSFLRMDGIRRQFAVLVPLIAIMSLSEDFSYGHVRYIDSAMVNFRLKHSDPELHYLRLDFRSPAEYINRNAGLEDIIIISNPTLDHYLDRFDFMYINQELRAFGTRVCDSGRVDKWTGMPAVHTEDRLFDLVENADTKVWLVVQTRFGKQFDYNLAERYREHVVFSGIDEGLTIFKIE